MIAELNSLMQGNEAICNAPGELVNIVQNWLREEVFRPFRELDSELRKFDWIEWPETTDYKLGHFLKPFGLF